MQILIYPSVDLTFSSESFTTYGTGYYLRTEACRHYASLYVGSDPTALPLTDPLVSPLLQPDQ
jgi:acetyl esterase/lipase